MRQNESDRGFKILRRRCDDEKICCCRGPQGEPGKTPVVTVGETETLPPGSAAEVTAVQTSDGVELNFGIPQGEAAKDVFASFVLFEIRLTNGQLIPLMTATPDTTGNIVLQDDTRIVLNPGYYHITYSVSAVLDTPGYMQITPSYNGASHLEYGIYFKTNTALSSAYGTSSIIISVPSQTNFTLTYNSNVQSRSGAATVAIIKLNR